MYQPVTKKEKELIRLVLRKYRIGENNLTFKRDITGFVNKTFLVQSGKNKYILKQYNENKSISHLKLEVEVLNYLREKKFDIVPKIISTIKGKPYIKIANTLFTLQSFVKGKIKASWHNPEKLSIRQFENFFKSSAKFSKTVESFKTEIRVKNHSIYYYARNAKKDLTKYYNQMPHSRGKILLKKHFATLNNIIEKNRVALENSNYDRLPKQLVHFDIHPGNVSYKGDAVTGLFDFDWIRFDSRISDLAGTIAQVCYYYGGPKDGLYRKDKIDLGLKVYRKEYGRSEFSLERENELIKTALQGYQIFQLVYFSLEPYIKKGQSFEYYRIIDHFIKLLTLNDFDELFS